MKTISDEEYYLLEALRINYDAAKQYDTATCHWRVHEIDDYVAAKLATVPVPCKHANRIAAWDHLECEDCGSIYFSGGHGIASNMWFESLDVAKFYEVNGRLPDGARATWPVKKA